MSVVAGLAIHSAGITRAVYVGRTPEAALLGVSACVHGGVFLAHLYFEELRLSDGVGALFLGASVLGEATLLAVMLGAALHVSRSAR